MASQFCAHPEKVKEAREDQQKKLSGLPDCSCYPDSANTLPILQAEELRMKGEFSAINYLIEIAENIILVTFWCSIFAYKNIGS